MSLKSSHQQQDVHLLPAAIQITVILSTAYDEGKEHNKDGLRYEIFISELSRKYIFFGKLTETERSLGTP